MRPSARLRTTVVSALAAAVGATALLGAGPVQAQASESPNIVVVVLDDIPEVPLQFWERFPNIDKLFVREGLRFTNAHVNAPYCGPSRAGLLTGRSVTNHGVWGNDPTLFDPSVTIASELQDQGYWTQLSGKYINGPGSPEPLVGWDRYAYTGNSYLGFTERTHDGDVKRKAKWKNYQPDVTFERAVEFMRDAPKDDPVFALLAPFTPHGGRDPDDPDFDHKNPLPALRHQGDPRCADIEPWSTPAHTEPATNRPAYQSEWEVDYEARDLVPICESLLAVDEGVKDLRDELVRQDRMRDTLFILTSDNGMGWGAHDRHGKNVDFATSVPLYARWPDARGKAAGTVDEYVSLIDLAPTFCAAAGCEMGPFADGPPEADGSSILGLITGEETAVEREALLTQDWFVYPWDAIRTTSHFEHGEWHYARYEDGTTEMYDASGGPCFEWSPGDPGDPCELTNVAGEPAYAEIEADLAMLFEEAVATGGAHERLKAEPAPNEA